MKRDLCPTAGHRLPRQITIQAFLDLIVSVVVAIGLSAIGATTIADSAASSYGQRRLYAVNESLNARGTISVYDIDAGHRLIKTIQTVPDVDDVKGVAANRVTGRLYVTYRDRVGPGQDNRLLATIAS
jgi:hypothetical protein